MDSAASAATATVTSNLDLFDFIESLEKEEEKKYSTTAIAAAVLNNTNIDYNTAAVSDSSVISNHQQDPDETVDVWQDIADALNNWSERILSIESRYTKTIEESLARQQLDGFLNHQDVSELRYTTSNLMLYCGLYFC